MGTHYLGVRHPWLNLLVLTMLLVTTQALSETATDEQQARQDRLQDILAGNGDQAAAATASAGTLDPARPRTLPGASTDPETRRKYEQALQDYYEYRSEGLQHRRAVFRWQLFSAKLIFVIVLVLVGCGILFAAIQFRRGMQQPSDHAGESERLSTEMEISSKGIRVNSPVLGVIILTLSLAFFYLYLVYVYPIENIF